MFSRFDLRGSRALLTGASSGIGWALAQRLAEQGVRLVLASRNRDRLTTLAGAIRREGGEAVVAQTDVTNPAHRTRLVETTLAALGGLDLLLNNAGVGAMGWFADAGEERLRRIFEVNFFAATELTRLVLPHLRHNQRAMLVNISSVLGRRAVPGCTEYCASKFALSGWSEGLRAELARDGVHVLLVCPGVIETEFRANLIEDRVRFRWQRRRAMTADRCARLIVRAMQKRRHELVLTGQGKLLVGINRLWPRLVDFLLARYARTGK
jgi:short-subunit dehydrogenase